MKTWTEMLQRLAKHQVDLDDATARQRATERVLARSREDVITALRSYVDIAISQHNADPTSWYIDGTSCKIIVNALTGTVNLSVSLHDADGKEPHDMTLVDSSDLSKEFGEHLNAELVEANIPLKFGSLSIPAFCFAYVD